MNNFLQKVKENYKENEIAEIQYAYEFALSAHAGQFRLSGEPYIEHPIAVAEILIDLGMDSSSIIAALLHDVLEDTQISPAILQQKFGKEITEMVDGVTKMKSVEEKHNDINIETLEAENYRKFLIAITKDIRVLIVKLADRLHNMQTMDAQSPEKQKKKAMETLDIYAPLAGRLGISQLKVQLQDLSLKYIDPEMYAFLSEQIGKRSNERMKVVNHLRDLIAEEIEKQGISYEIKARPKHMYSIYKKMKQQNKTLDEIYDLIAVRVIVPTVQDCYSVLGFIHNKWKPLPGRIKDYIATPKPNNYQSLHTTVITDFKQIFEIQIRTREMNAIAEYGIAAHWKYKEGRLTSSMTELDKSFNFLREVMDVENDLKDAGEFLEALKINVDSNEIYVFTPKGRLINMPIGSTCIDFAYYIHSEVGNRCVGARINQRIAHLNSPLASGDVVEILTNNNSKGPSRDWLNFAKTPTAKAKIKAFFKKSLKEDNIRLGKDMLEKEAIRKGYKLPDLLLPASLKVIFDKYMFSDIEDMYASVGCGSIKINQVLLKLIDFYRKSLSAETEQSFNGVSLQQTRPRHSSGIIIDGYDDFLIHIAHCCSPVPGDDIVGYITRGRGVVVHRLTCPNVKNLEEERRIDAEWNKEVASTFNAPLIIETENNGTVLSKVTNTMVKMGLQINSFFAQASKNNDRMIIKVVVVISKLTDVNDLIQKILAEKDVISAARET